MDKILNFFGKGKIKQEKTRNHDNDVRNLNNIMNTQQHSNANDHHDKNMEDNTINNQMASNLNKIENETNGINWDIMNKKTKSNNVVVVNSDENIIKKSEGYYYKKYVGQIQKLCLSNPILIEREKMKVNFDTEAIDYLVDDLTFIFREKQKTIDSNQVNKNFH